MWIVLRIDYLTAALLLTNAFVPRLQTTSHTWASDICRIPRCLIWPTSQLCYSKTYECAVYRYQKTAVFKLIASSAAAAVAALYSPVSTVEHQCNKRRLIIYSIKTNGTADLTGITGRSFNLTEVHSLVWRYRCAVGGGGAPDRGCGASPRSVYTG